MHHFAIRKRNPRDNPDVRSPAGAAPCLKPERLNLSGQPVLDHFIHFDGKLFRTLMPLFFLPGRVPKDYLENKRGRYIKPLKLYLGSIALAFSAFQFLS